jgi:Sensors of blue-light using FAD
MSACAAATSNRSPYWLTNLRNAVLIKVFDDRPLGGSAMYQMIYVSEATEQFQPGDPQKMLDVARSNNLIVGVTGMLVFRNGQFLQVLEGGPTAVISTYDRIAADSRHRDLIVLHRGYSHVGKTFSALSMGFQVQSLTDPLSSQTCPLDFYHFDGLAALDFLVACRPRDALPV